MESVNHFINENKKMIVSFADGVSVGLLSFPVLDIN